MEQQEIAAILKSIGAAPLHSLGQHFLVCDETLQNIINTAHLTPTDNILEIGPGLGVLTKKLVEKSGRVVAIEKDPKYAAYLQNLFHPNSNFTLIKDDILSADIPDLLRNYFPESPQEYKLIANLPYNIATKIIRLFLASKDLYRPRQIVVMVQKEVAERLSAKPPHMNYLACFVQLVAVPKIICAVPSACFFPKPAVDSAVVAFSEIARDFDYHSNVNKALLRFLKIGFRAPRKTLVNNLTAGLSIKKEQVELILKKLDKSKTARAQEFSLEEWGHISRNLSIFVKF